ncbi:MAG: malonyl-CoA decarboxylase family protein [Pseudomonadota bacterium]
MATKKADSEKAGRGDLVGLLIQDIKACLGAKNIDQGQLVRIKDGFQRLDRSSKPFFFTRFLETVEVSPQKALPLLNEALGAAKDPAGWKNALVKLREAIESPRSRLLHRFIGAPGGLKFLLDLRADVLSAQGTGTGGLGPLDHDLVSLFESWFQDGFLFLHEITQDSPYRQIELIMNGDMVHPMTRLEEMGKRMGRDRRCFALYHHAMPEEPVVFIEVALTRGLARSIHEILDGKGAGDEDVKKDTAIFYSINNTQNGLSGLGLGKVLIFQVVAFLKRDTPEIKNFCTLSPLPGFWRRYLKPLLEKKTSNFKLSRQNLEKFFDRRSRTLLEKMYLEMGGSTGRELSDILLGVFSSREWAKNRALVNSLAKPLAKLGHYYLVEEKDLMGRPLDPVANFHLGNGATLSPADVNFGANWSAMGLERSLSLMVNYVYSQGRLGQIGASAAKLGGFIPGLSRRKTDRYFETDN